MAAVHRVMHSVSASIEYVCSTTTAANSGPTTSLCTAGNATRPIAAIEGASAITAVRTTSVAPGLVISVLRREYSLAWSSVQVHRPVLVWIARIRWCRGRTDPRLAPGPGRDGSPARPGSGGEALARRVRGGAERRPYFTRY